VPQVHGDIEPPLAGIDFYEGDIRNAKLVWRGQMVLFRLAAEVGVGQSMYEIARYVGSNDLGIRSGHCADEPQRRNALGLHQDHPEIPTIAHAAPVRWTWAVRRHHEP
jgi:hypothetical protein